MDAAFFLLAFSEKRLERRLKRVLAKRARWGQDRAHQEEVKIRKQMSFADLDSERSGRNSKLGQPGEAKRVEIDTEGSAVHGESVSAAEATAVQGKAEAKARNICAHTGAGVISDADMGNAIVAADVEQQVASLAAAIEEQEQQLGELSQLQQRQRQIQIFQTRLVELDARIGVEREKQRELQRCQSPLSSVPLSSVSSPTPALRRAPSLTSSVSPFVLAPRVMPMVIQQAPTLPDPSNPAGGTWRSGGVSDHVSSQRRARNLLEEWRRQRGFGAPTVDR